MTRWVTLLALSSVSMLLAAQPDAARQAELRHLLQQDCGSCHGLTLRGGLGPPLRPEDLTGKPRTFLLHTIMEGRPGTAMPPWRPLLSESDAGWLVDRLLDGEGLQ